MQAGAPSCMSIFEWNIPTVTDLHDSSLACCQAFKSQGGVLQTEFTFLDFVHSCSQFLAWQSVSKDDQARHMPTHTLQQAGLQMQTQSRLQ